MSNPKGNLATLHKYTSKWHHKNTRTIRVPVALADEILDYAHKLDEGEALTQLNDGNNDKILAASESLKQTLSQVLEVLERICETPNTSKFTKALKVKLQTEAIEPLKSLTQVNS